MYNMHKTKECTGDAVKAHIPTQFPNPGRLPGIAALVVKGQSLCLFPVFIDHNHPRIPNICRHQLVYKKKIHTHMGTLPNCQSIKHKAAVVPQAADDPLSPVPDINLSSISIQAFLSARIGSVGSNSRFAFSTPGNWSLANLAAWAPPCPSYTAMKEYLVS